MMDNSVVFLPAAQDACAFFRMYIPHLSIPNSDYYLTGWQPNGTPKVMDVHRVAYRKVAVVQRQSSEFNLQALRTLKGMGLKIIYDLDDNVWNLPAGNPAKQIFMENASGFAACAQEADVLTVSTIGLKTAVTTAFTFNKEVFVVPNAINFDMFKPKEMEREEVLIGWGGSNTHSSDFRELRRVLWEVLDACPQSRLEMAGASPKKQVEERVVIVEVKEKEKQLKIEIMRTKQQLEIPWINFDKKRYYKGKILDWKGLVDDEIVQHPKFQFKRWAPTREYPNRLSSWGWDISLAPLEDVRFNESKSNLKMLEAGAMKIPCLVSNVKPYQEFCALGGDDLKWLLCNKTGDWYSKLITLVNEPERRTYLGQKMYDVTKKYFNIESITNNWQYVLEKALSQ